MPPSFHLPRDADDFDLGRPEARRENRHLQAFHGAHPSCLPSGVPGKASLSRITQAGRASKMPGSCARAKGTTVTR